jgi:hypothetical protein
MTHFKPILRVSAAALFASAPAAFADVTAADVWAQFKSYMQTGGQTMSVGSEQMAGDTLTITDLQIAMDSPEAGVNATISILTFKENGDGTVTVTLPPEYPLALTMKPEGESEGTMNMVIKQTNLTAIASGTPENLNYAYAGEKIAVVLESLDLADDEPPVDMTMEMAFNGVSGTYSIGSGEMRAFTAATNAASLTIDAHIEAPDEDTTVEVHLNASNLASSSSGSLPATANYADMAAMIASGFAVTGALNYGASQFSFEINEAGDETSIQGTGATGGIDFKMSGDGISYATRGTGLDMSVSGGDIPFPSIDVQLAEGGFGLTMPLSKSDSPKPVGLLVKLVGLAVNDDIWGMIDPGGALPHDPATLIVSVSGTANWLVDIMAPDAEEQMAMGMPGMLHSLAIDELQVSIAGADLTGTGAFTFDNEDMMTWGGMPAPDGSVDLALSGGNGLIDKLVTMGLLPQDQAMGARMMMGMFARPGDGPDNLVSKIEVKKEGSIFANGQQIK